MNLVTPGVQESRAAQFSTSIRPSGIPIYNSGFQVWLNVCFISQMHTIHWMFHLWGTKENQIPILSNLWKGRTTSNLQGSICTSSALEKFWVPIAKRWWMIDDSSPSLEGRVSFELPRQRSPQIRERMRRGGLKSEPLLQEEGYEKGGL